MQQYAGRSALGSAEEAEYASFFPSDKVYEFSHFQDGDVNAGSRVPGARSAVS